MAQIGIHNLTFSYEGSSDNIFENVSFVIDTDWKLGLIGRNGKGKTTFLNLLLGKYPYEGSISTRAVFDYFPYSVSPKQRELPAAEFLDSLKPQSELWRVICELEQMGEDAQILYRPFGTLSPGQQTKLLLAVLFSGEQDFLLIDEPTNHLDQETREMVKEYLASKKGFLLVSHDRDLLDGCVDHILALNRNTIEVQSGNFSSWWENKQRRDHFEQEENEKHRKEIRKLRQASARTALWADQNERTKIGFDPAKEHDRFIGTRSYIGAKTKKMQSRVKQMENRIQREIEEKEGLLADLEKTVELKMTPVAHHKKVLVRADDYAAGYTGYPAVFSGVTFTVEAGDRVALQGPNGCGKSTLLKLIAERTGLRETGGQTWEQGNCDTASGLVISYVNQDTGMLRGGISDFCREKELEESLFCAILRQLDLGREQFGKPIEDYSEGQKKKVLLAASLLTPAHLYVWDEPLNYIDVFSRMQIERLLLEYQPTMLFVEHDVRFREKIATKIVDMTS